MEKEHQVLTREGPPQFSSPNYPHQQYGAQSQAPPYPAPPQPQPSTSQGSPPYSPPPQTQPVPPYHFSQSPYPQVPPKSHQSPPNQNQSYQSPPNTGYNSSGTNTYSGRLGNFEKKHIVETYLLAISPLGLIGAHHFYLRRYYWGILYFFTLGLCGCGYIADLFRIPCLVKEANEKYQREQQPGLTPVVENKTLSDAYVLWFPFGLLGFHHYYLGNTLWGVCYTFTFGIFGIGWLIDACRMPSLVRAARERSQSPHFDQDKSTCGALCLGMSPLGILGAHHYYLQRPIWGVVYTFTLGLMGTGWVFDWFRMHVLTRRCNDVLKGIRSPHRKTLDDTYILWFLFGFVGYHHFYLNRPVWGLVYFFTFGMLGIGWLIDMVRIPFLVKHANERLEEEQRRLVAVRTEAGIAGSGGQLPHIVCSGPHTIMNPQGYTNYGLVTSTTNPYPQTSGYAYGNPPMPPPMGGAPHYDNGAPYPQMAPPPYTPTASGYGSGQTEELPQKK